MNEPAMNDASQPGDGSQPALPPPSPEPPPSGSQFSGQSSAPLNSPPATDPARAWNVACHAAAFSGYISAGVGWIVGPLVVWLIKKADFPSVDEHGKESLNFHISIAIYSLVMGVLGMFTCGVTWVLNVALVIMQVVCTVLASIKASDGGFYRYPLTIRMIT